MDFLSDNEHIYALLLLLSFHCSIRYIIHMPHNQRRLITFSRMKEKIPQYTLEFPWILVYSFHSLYSLGKIGVGFQWTHNTLFIPKFMHLDLCINDIDANTTFNFGKVCKRKNENTEPKISDAEQKVEK